MTLRHEAYKMYRKKKIIPVCSISWSDFKNNKRNTLDIRVNNEWIIFKPPCSRSEIENYKYWSHTYSPNAIKYNFAKHYKTGYDKGKW